MRIARNSLFAVPLVALLSTAVVCIAGCDSNTNAGGDSAPGLATAVIPVDGMTCGACAARVKGTLKDIDGVADVEVSLAERNVRVRFADEKVNPERLAEAITELGYKATVPPSRESEAEQPQAAPEFKAGTPTGKGE